MGCVHCTLYSTIEGGCTMLRGGGEPRTYILYGLFSVGGGQKGGGEVRGGVRGSIRQLC